MDLKDVKKKDPNVYRLRSFYRDELERIEEQIKSLQSAINGLSDRRAALEVGMTILEKYDAQKS